MGNEVINHFLIYGPEKDLDEIICRGEVVERVSRHCLKMKDRIRQRHLWGYLCDMLNSHKDCWIFNHFVEELNGGQGVWIGFYQGDKEVIQSRFWEGPCAEHWRHMTNQYCDHNRVSNKSVSNNNVETPFVPNPTDKIYNNNLEVCGGNFNFLYENSRPIWDISCNKSQSYAKCKTIHSPLSNELEKLLEKEDEMYAQNIYSNDDGDAGAWVCFKYENYEDKKQKIDIEHHTWKTLSKEEIESFELYGINKVQKADAYMCGDPYEAYVSTENDRVFCARIGDEVRQVWFAKGA